MTHRQTSWLDQEPTAVRRPPALEELRPVGLPIADAARYLGVSRWTVQRLRARGELRGFHIGAAAMIEVASLDAYVARRFAEGG
jgi:excisionase family DNA binding protein